MARRADLTQVLQQVLNADNVQRALAEEELEFQSQKDGFYCDLADYATALVEPSRPLSLRLVALSVLKQRVPQLGATPNALELMQVLILLMNGYQSMSSVFQQLGPEASQQLKSAEDSIMRQTAAVISGILVQLERRGDDSFAAHEAKDGSARHDLSSAIDLFFETATAALSELAWDTSALPYYAALMVLELTECLSNDSMLWTELLLNLLQPLCHVALRFPLSAQATKCAFFFQPQTVAARAAESIFLWALLHLSGKSDEMKLVRAMWNENVGLLITCAFTPYSHILSFLGGLLHHSSALVPPPLITAWLLYQQQILSLFSAVAFARNWIRDFASQHLLESILNSLQEDAGLYHESLLAVALRGLDGGEIAIGEDDPKQSKLLLSQIFAKKWSIFSALLELPVLRSTFQRCIGGENMPAYYLLLWAYIYLDEDERSNYETDPNIFLLHEGEREDSIQWRVRDVVSHVYEQTLKLLGPAFTRNALNHVSNVICVGEASQVWREREAALFMIECALLRCYKWVVEFDCVDVVALISAVLTKDVCSPVMVVSARAFLLLSRLLHFTCKKNRLFGKDDAENRIVENTCAQLFLHAVRSLTSHLLICAAACKLLFDLIPITPIALLQKNSIAEEGLQRVLTLLLHDSISGEFLYLCFDVLMRWMKRIRRSSAEGAAALSAIPLSVSTGNVLLQCWHKHIGDPNMGDCMVTVFRELIKYPETDQGFFTTTLSWMGRIMGGTCTETEFCAVPYVIQIVTAFFGSDSNDVVNETAAYILDSLCKLLLQTDESAILQSACACLATLLRRCSQSEPVCVYMPQSLLPPATLECFSADSIGVRSFVPNFLSFPLAASEAVPPFISNLNEKRACYRLTYVITTIVLRMLRDEASESALMGVGKPIMTIMENAPKFDANDVVQLLNAVARRLSSVRTSVVTQQLLMPLAALLKLYPQSFMHTLQHSGLLQATFSRWLSHLDTMTDRDGILRFSDVLLNLLLKIEALPCSGLQETILTVEWSATARRKGAMSWNRVNKKDAVKKHREGAAGPNTLPLPLAIFVALGKAMVRIINLPQSGGYDAEAEEERCESSEEGVGEEIFSDKEEESGKENSWCTDEEAESASDGEAFSRMDGAVPFSDESGEEGLRNRSRPPARAGIQQELRAVFARMLPVLQLYGELARPFFTSEELISIKDLFSSFTRQEV